MNTDTLDLKNIKTAYFVGIGGIGISAIARMLMLQGIKVYGSDRDASKVTDELAKTGATIFIGQKKENIESITEMIDLYVYTVAIPEENSELKVARASDVYVLSYPQMLNVASKEKYTIAISGTHGKTTTTAMVVKIMIDAGLDPTVIIGSLIDQHTNFIAGKSKYLVVEADEYKKSFHNLQPSVLLINNLDEDHLDFYKDLADIQDSFFEVAQKIPKEGFLIANTDDIHVQPVLKNATSTIVSYQYEKIDFTLRVPGEHNRSNARAALAVASVLGIDSKKAKQSLGEFTGVWRRFEYKGITKKGIVVYDDYAHNPQKVKALLSGAREYFGKDKRIVVVFQPHLFSRTKTLFSLFVESFDDADMVLLTPIFPAREIFDPTISSDMLAEALKEQRNKYACSFKTFKEIEDFLELNLKKEDVLITVGAGEAYKIGETLLA